MSRTDALMPLREALSEINKLQLKRCYTASLWSRAPAIIFLAPDGFGNDFGQMVAQATQQGATRYMWVVLGFWANCGKVWELTIRDPRMAGCIPWRRAWLEADVRHIAFMLAGYRQLGVQTRQYTRKEKPVLEAFAQESGVV